MHSPLEEILTQKNIRPTAMRLLVLQHMQNSSATISLSDLEQTFERSDRITLYRTLKTFQDNGLVHSIDDGTGSPKYAFCQEGCECRYARDLHVHFHCRQCQETYCLPNNKIPNINLPDRFQPEEASLVVKGTCANCAS